MFRAKAISHSHSASFCRLSILLTLAAAASARDSSAQQQERPIVAEGYITSTHLPASFDINVEHILLEPGTAYGLIGEKTASTISPLRNALHAGAYVQVLGDKTAGPASAKIILFRDDTGRQLAGLGVIVKVVSSGSEPVFEADGYRIRISPSTTTSFGGDLKTLAEVHPNIWLRYQAKRAGDGVLVATKAEFIPPKPVNFKKIKALEEVEWDFQPPRSELKSTMAAKQNSVLPYDVSDQETVLTQDGYVSFGFRKGKHRIPADQALQSRIRHIGMRLVPDYQKHLPANDPSKINFRFYAIEDDKARTEINSFEGLILVPISVVQRLKTDDELAALLADGVAFNLQRQAARLVANNRASYGAEAAGLIAGAFVPGLGLAAEAGVLVAGGKVQQELEEQRARVALSLLAESGFDPWQAPEVWRLVAAKHLPSDLSTLKYPAISGYQLGILNLQYRNTGSAPNLSSR